MILIRILNNSIVKELGGDCSPHRKFADPKADHSPTLNYSFVPLQQDGQAPCQACEGLLTHCNYFTLQSVLVRHYEEELIHARRLK